LGVLIRYMRAAMRRDSLEARPLPELVRGPWPAGWSAAGIIEVLEPFVLPDRCVRLQSALAARLSTVTVVLDRPHDPHNGAAVLRSCDAFGVQNVHVVVAHERFLVSRVVTRRAERWLDVHQYTAPERALGTLHAGGFEVVTTHPQGELLPEQLRDIPKLALVLGNEHGGIDEPFVRAAGRSVRIPMRGLVESLNVSVSAAILLHAAVQNRPGNLSLDEQRRLYARGLYQTVKRAEVVLASQSPR
jgi:tRNA (guanosine-2'-O-)-methyltransferase